MAWILRLSTWFQLRYRFLYNCPPSMRSICSITACYTSPILGDRRSSRMGQSGLLSRATSSQKYSRLDIASEMLSPMPSMSWRRWVTFLWLGLTPASSSLSLISRSFSMTRSSLLIILSSSLSRCTSKSLSCITIIQLSLTPRFIDGMNQLIVLGLEGWMWEDWRVVVGVEVTQDIVCMVGWYATGTVLIWTKSQRKQVTIVEHWVKSPQLASEHSYQEQINRQHFM